jgi:hypothetical protein
MSSPSHVSDGAAKSVLVIDHPGVAGPHQGDVVDRPSATSARQGATAGAHQGVSADCKGVINRRGVTTDRQGAAVDCQGATTNRQVVDQSSMCHRRPSGCHS